MGSSEKPVTALAPLWSLDMSTAPLGQKLLAMNPGGVAVFASLTPSTLKHFIAWCGLPKLTPDQKEEIFYVQRKFSLVNP